MVKTKIDHAIFWCTVTSNTTGNLSLSAHSSLVCILKASITGKLYTFTYLRPSKLLANGEAQSP